MKVLGYILDKIFTFATSALEKVRILPMLIFMCCLSFSVKIGNSIYGLYILFSSDSVMAYEDGATKTVKPETLQDKINFPRLAPVDTPKDKKIEDTKIDLMDLTPEALKGLHDMAQEQERQQERSDTVQNKEELLKLHEQRLDEKLGEIRSAKKAIEGQLDAFNTSENEKLKKLITIMEQLSPKKAAPIFEKMKTEDAVRLMESMKELKVAAIFGFMKTEDATRITQALLDRRMSILEKNQPSVATPSLTPKVSEPSLPDVPTFINTLPGG